MLALIAPGTGFAQTRDAGLSDVREMLGVDVNRQLMAKKNAPATLGKVIKPEGHGLSDARAMLGVDLDIGLSAMSSRGLPGHRQPPLLPSRAAAAGPKPASSASAAPRKAFNNLSLRRTLSHGRTGPAETGKTATRDRGGLLGRLGL